MARHYKYINFSDRREIAALYQANARPADIAGRLGVATAMIYREQKHWETGNEEIVDIVQGYTHALDDIHDLLRQFRDGPASGHGVQRLPVGLGAP